MLNPIILLQVLTGLGMLSHGVPKISNMNNTLSWFKKQGYPAFFGVIAAVVESIGALLLIIGILPRIMATLIAMVMLGAMYHHWRNKEGFRDGWESSYLYFVASVVIAISGTGWV